jgi:hypothetical protein
MLINPYKVVPADTAFEAAFLQLDVGDSIATNTATWTGVNFGAVHTNRKIYCSVHTRIVAGATLSSATIGGVAATIHVQTSKSFVGADQLVAIISADLPQGIESGDVTATFTAAPPDPATTERLYLGVYRVINQTGVDDTHSLTGGTNTGPASQTLDPTVVGGAVIAAHTSASGTAAFTTTWTNVVVTFDQEFVGHGSSQCSGALLTGLAGVTQGFNQTHANNGDWALVGVAIH